MKKTVAVFLCVLTLLSALTSCGQQEEKNDTANPAESTSAVSVPEETGRSKTKDNLPSDLDLKGMTVGIFTNSTNCAYDVDGGGEESGDIVKDAVYKRNRKDFLLQPE